MATIAVSGATGFIGSALCAALRARGHRVVQLRRPSSKASQEPGVTWDPARGQLDPAALEGLDALVHLAGEGVANGRWSEAQKARIKESRVRGTTLLAGTLAQLTHKPRVLICASAIGIYGDRGDAPVDEETPPGSDFLAEVGMAWEAATGPAEQAGMRVVHARFGLVLDPSGGMLARLLTPFRLGLGGKLGSGHQFMSWIARSDAVRALLHALEAPALRGAVNITAPEPVRNAEFTAALGHVLRRPTVFTVPAFAARAAFGEMADVALLGGARVLPKRLLSTGFTFEQPLLEPCLRTLLR